MVGGLRFVAAWQVPTASALCQARKRLGGQPVRRLFERAAAPVAHQWFGHRRRLMAVEGVRVDVPDTVDNKAEFGRPGSRTGQGGAFPQARVGGLGECGTHAIVAAELGPISTRERELAHDVLAALEDGMLVRFDRGLFSYDFYAASRATGADVLFRVASSLKHPVLARLPDDSCLFAVTGNGTSTPTTLGQARWKAAAGQAVLVRVVDYQITDRDSGEVYRLITSITDWREAFAPDLAAAYQRV
jgi:hypothetical protein